MARRFPKEVHEFIAANVAGRTTRELAALVNERFGEDLFSESSMKSYKTNHKLRSGTPCGTVAGTPSKAFPAHIMAYISENYSGCGPTEMAERLNAKFGTNYTARRLKSYYGNHHLNSGVSGCFEKGNIPPNKGKKGVCAPGCEKTHFKRGHLPSNTKPIGYERISRDGYVEVKVKMRPSNPVCNDNFVAKHRLIWEQLHGPIPDNCVVIFKDGDKQNFDPSNLALVTKAERLQMTRRGLFSSDPEMTEVGMMVAKVQTTAFALQKKKGRAHGKE